MMVASVMRTKGMLLALLAIVVVIGLAALGGPASGQGTSDGPAQTLRFDVAEDMSRFVFDQTVAFEDGMPKHGSPFITQGYIYEAGTLSGGNGVLEDGSPEFPDKVIGEWTCRGWFVGEGAHAKTGPMVITTQLYNFGEGLGDETIVSEGYELADVGVVIQRAITGGTGEYTGIEGEVKQTFLGFNASEGVNLTFEVEFARS
ncbi:MAG: hypothetical protein QOF73_1479 [Thermomicrobiales bacterium]|nr:hypothetical protein [Thermomicrobiales bacterium]